MKAVTYQGIKNVIVKEVSDPKIEKADDEMTKGGPMLSLTVRE